MNSSPYIDLLKNTLIDHLKIDSLEYHPLEIVDPNWKTWFLFPLNKILRKKNFGICKIKPVNRENRLNGSDWPANALTMIGLKRLNNIEFCTNTIVRENIPGDFIETGVWRGGATILMKALLEESNQNHRKVWLADSFKGLPEPNLEKYPADKASDLHKRKILSVSKKEVEQNFEKFNLLDEQIVFVEGWFKDTLPNLHIGQIALLRLDGDLYESTYLALKFLYPKLAPGGFVIVDDYNAFPYCKQAVDCYRNENGIEQELIRVDAEAVFWRK